MKKLFIFASFCTFLFSCNNIDSTKLKEEIIAEVKQEIINELKEVEKPKAKGTGFYFYNEQVSIGGEGYYTHHSTLDCPAIKGGVQRDFYYSAKETKNLFCPQCMDDQLITLFSQRFFPKKD